MDRSVWSGSVTPKDLGGNGCYDYNILLILLVDT